MDFSFNNTAIKQYFDGIGNYVPSGELLYIHTHPLILPNFLVQLQAYILATGKIIKEKKVTGNVIQQLEQAALTIGTTVENLSQENAPIVLGAMRDAYSICKSITRKDILDFIGKPVTK